MSASKSSQLTAEQSEQLLTTLKARFEKNKSLHPKLEWAKISQKLENNPDKLWTLYQMEQTGGEPDVLKYDEKTDKYSFYDCSPESPKERRSLCYDQQALDARKENKPRHSAIGMAKEIGIELLDEEQYRFLQQFGAFDLKTSSWLLSPEKIRKLGGAIFGDKRYDTVFTYHNGAESYYAARGFRGFVEI